MLDATPDALSHRPGISRSQHNKPEGDLQRAVSQSTLNPDGLSHRLDISEYQRHTNGGLLQYHSPSPCSVDERNYEHLHRLGISQYKRNTEGVACITYRPVQYANGCDEGQIGLKHTPACSTKPQRTNRSTETTQFASVTKTPVYSRLTPSIKTAGDETTLFASETQTPPYSAKPPA